MFLGKQGGSPARPVVAVGDSVKVGQLLADSEGRVSSPIHSSVAGKVKSIDEFDPVTGERGDKTASIAITTDSKQTVFEGLAPPVVEDTASFLAAVRASGVVGLGGAGYPTASKLTLKEGTALDYILVNSAECEPYIT